MQDVIRELEELTQEDLCEIYDTGLFNDFTTACIYRVLKRTGIQAQDIDKLVAEFEAEQDQLEALALLGELEELQDERIRISIE